MCCFLFLIIRRPPISTRTDTLCPCTTLFRSYLAGLVGSSNNPVSGITIATILFASVVLIVLLGRDSPIGAVAAIMIGAVVCCAAAVGGDNLQEIGRASCRERVCQYV